MNKKGQTLVLFIILLPLLSTLLAFIVDTGLIYGEKIKLDGINKEASRYYIKTSDENKTKELIHKNNKNIEINIETNQIILITKINSVFGKIIGKNEYEIKSTYILNGKKITKGE